MFLWMLHWALEKNIFRHKTIKAIVYRSSCEMSWKQHMKRVLMQKWCMCSGFPDDATGQGGDSLTVLSFQIIRAASVFWCISPWANILRSRVVVTETKSFDSSFGDRCQKFKSIYFAWTYKKNKIISTPDLRHTESAHRLLRRVAV